MRCEERRSKTPPTTPTIAASARQTSSGRVFIEALWPRRERDGSLEKQKVNFVEFILREPIGRGDERQFPYLVRMASAEPRCAKPCCRAWQTDQVGNGRVPQCNVPRVVPIIVREKAIALACIRLVATPLIIRQATTRAHSTRSGLLSSTMSACRNCLTVSLGYTADTRVLPTVVNELAIWFANVFIVATGPRQTRARSNAYSTRSWPLSSR